MDTPYGVPFSLEKDPSLYSFHAIMGIQITLRNHMVQSIFTQLITSHVSKHHDDEAFSLAYTEFIITYLLAGAGMPMGPLPVLTLAASAAVGYLLAQRAVLEMLLHLEAIDAKAGLLPSERRAVRRLRPQVWPCQVDNLVIHLDLFRCCCKDTGKVQLGID